MKITTCPHCRSTKHERAEEQSSVATPCDRCGPIFEAGCADERARIRKACLDAASQSKSVASRASGMAQIEQDARTRAFQAAAKLCDPPMPKKLSKKRAARKAANP